SPHFDAARVEIVHARAAEVGELYRRVDVACAGFGGEYQAIAVPVKSVEAMGYGTPLLLRRPSAAARLVESEGYGWVVDDASLPGLITRLRDDPQMVSAAARRARAARHRHTWEARARRVLEVFAEVRGET
ncbi:MAG: glycosyltransferase family 1 protein, partial [Actinomyces sp.]